MAKPIPLSVDLRRVNLRAIPSPKHRLLPRLLAVEGLPRFVVLNKVERVAFVTPHTDEMMPPIALRLTDKDPDEEIDYCFNWTARLVIPGSAPTDPRDTIASSVWEASSDDLVLTNDAVSDDDTTIFIRGGATGREYQLKNTIVTDGGRTLVQTAILRISKRTFN